ncbi:MAG TPA: hypothetical protein V6D28_25715 [Leptolyngbyaceae cyanobacterium]
MSIPSKIKTTPNCAVFCRNYQQHLEDASNKSPDERITFRSYLKWTSAELAVKTHGHRKIYFALGEDSLVRYEAVLELVELDPKPNTHLTNNLLEKCLPSTHNEGLWEKENGEIGVKTLYVVSHCRKLPEPFPQTKLIKLSDNTPIDENFIRSYVLVYEI